MKDRYTRTAAMICCVVLGMAAIVFISLVEPLRTIGIVVAFICIYGLWQGWFDGIQRMFDERRRDEAHRDLLNSIRNINLKLDELERRPEDWQMRMIYMNALPHWMQLFDIENCSDSEVQQKAKEVGLRLLRVSKGCDAIPIEIREAFAAKNKQLNFNLEQWEAKNLVRG